jgi:ABC-type antimicrobial peptide transport system permease subunit
MAAVAISTALLVSLLSVAEGISQNAITTIQTSHEDIIIVPNVPGGGGLRLLNNGHKLADEFRSDKTNISEVSPSSVWFLNVNPTNKKSENITTNSGPTEISDITTSKTSESGFVLSLGVIPERAKKFFTGNNIYNLDFIEIEFDSWFDISNDPHYENNFTGPWTYEVLIDEHLAKKFDLHVGSEVNIWLSSAPLTYTVKGIFKTNLMGGYFKDFVDGIIILHLSELQTLLGHDVVEIGNQTIITDSVETLAISLNPSRPKENKPDDIAFNIQEKYPLLEVLTKQEQLENLEEQNAMTNVFYTAISIVAIIIGFLFVACIMLISVYERINEIGMLRAIGISRFSIFKWVMLESMLIIALGILIGFLPGYVGSKLLGNYISTNIGISQELTAFSPGLLLSAFVGMFIIGSLISLIPALRASYMRVASALSFVR